MKKLLILALLIFISASCKKKTEDQSNQGAKTLDSVIARDVPKIDSGYRIFEGIYTVNINTSSFRDCTNPYTVYWLTDSTNKLKGMFEKNFPEKNVYNTVVTRVKGQLIPTENISLSENFPQTLLVNEIISVEKKNSVNTCVPYEFWGFGRKPEWSLQISKTENSIELNLPSENKSYNFFYTDPDEENGVIVYKNYNKVQGYLIEIRIKRERCYDETLDKYYDYSVEINLTGDKKFTGCCIKGTSQ